MCAQFLPDHGVMPELVYQLNLLGLSGAAEALPAFRRVLQEWGAGVRTWKIW